jgi:hypothetical protein
VCLGHSFSPQAILQEQTGEVRLLHTIISVSEPEIESFISFVLRCLKIRLLLFFVHTSPYLLTFLVYAEVVDFRPNEDCDVPRAERNEHLVPSAIQRLIVIPINIRTDYVTGLHAHVVYCGSNSTCAYGSSITRRDGNEDSVYIWMANKQSRQSPTRPVRCRLGEEL